MRYLYSAPYKTGQRRWTRKKLNFKIKWCYIIMSTTHSSFTKLLVIEPLLHPALKFAANAPWPNFQLCPSSQQILATPLVAMVNICWLSLFACCCIGRRNVLYVSDSPDRNHCALSTSPLCRAWFDVGITRVKLQLEKNCKADQSHHFHLSDPCRRMFTIQPCLGVDLTGIMGGRMAGLTIKVLLWL